MAAMAATPRMSTPRRASTPNRTSNNLSASARLSLATGGATPRLAASGKVPFLPGYTQESLLHKSHKLNQSLTYGPGGATDKLNTSSYSSAQGGLPKLDFAQLDKLADPMHRFDYSAKSMTHEERSARKESARNTYRPAIPPAWLKHDRQVLRFAAYFQEPVHENPKENFRIRHVMIYFYLEDGTMMISEPRVQNSGMPQGAFMKRHRIAKPDGSFYTYHDLNVSTSLKIHGHVFRIYDCDDFTREYYKEALGLNVEPREEMPCDSFHLSQLNENTSLDKSRNADLIEEKEYIELAMGGNRRNAKLQQFLENDRRVLHFKACWDDPTKYGARMYYTLHYNLADDTVEILECLARNSGRDPYPVFWKRSPLRKNPHINPTPGMLEPPAELYRPQDLIVGSTINVYGREILLYACDDFTRGFFRDYMGIEQDHTEIVAPDPVHVRLTHPPHTGFGAEEDSLASCLHLKPRPPKKDELKLMNESTNVLRFDSRLASGRPEDARREFVVSLHLADDSVSVWEKRQRNTGHTEGKFAKKGRKKNPDTGTWFKPDDFFVGATVEISGAPFNLRDADAWTAQYLTQVRGTVERPS